MVRCMGAKSSEVELEHSFKARQWYHVALTLSSGSALTPGWARLYVDGLLEASERFKYPKVHCRLTPCTAEWVLSWFVCVLHMLWSHQHGMASDNALLA